MTESLDDVKIEISENMGEQLRLTDIVVDRIATCLKSGIILILFVWKPVLLPIILLAILGWNSLLGIYYSLSLIENAKKLGKLLSVRAELLKSAEGQDDDD